ncbi:MAG: cytochrome c biogenesis protein CcdA [Dehalococcoidia bacterium]|nr:MAG: cytochrome c biogenesis protein CcdA [Dehalococcoidia bacterium]
MSLPVALDTVGRVARAYAVTGPPLTYFIDGQGIIREIVAGPLTPERSEFGLRVAFEAPPSAGASAPVESRGSALSAGGLALAVGAGMLSFLSPCVVPLLPGYLAFITGLSGAPGATVPAPVRGCRGRVMSRTAAFAFGLVLVFTVLGTSASVAGVWLADYRPLLIRVGGVLVLSFGLHMTGLLPIPLLYREFRPGLQSRALGGGGVLHAGLLGGAFALGWTPCVGPVLGSILLLASQTDAAAQGAVLLAAYGIGLGVPFIIAGLAADRALNALSPVRRYLGTIERISGALLIGTGMLLLAGGLAPLSAWLQRIA